MERGRLRIFIPNPHGADIGVKIIKKIISDIGVTEGEFYIL